MNGQRKRYRLPSIPTKPPGLRTLAVCLGASIFAAVVVAIGIVRHAGTTSILLLPGFSCLALILQNLHHRWHLRGRFKVKPVPCAGSNEEVLLEIVNEGAAVTMTAQLWISDCSPGAGFGWHRYTGQWYFGNFLDCEGGSERFDVRSRLPEHGDDLLRIARVETDSASSGIATMLLEGTRDGLSWEKDMDAAKPLPFYVLNIRLRAEEYRNAILLTYRVGPVTPFGPLSMELLS